MGDKIILTYWSACAPERREEFNLAIQCAPVLFGVALGNIVSVESAGIWNTISLPFACSDDKIRSRVLWNGNGRVILFLYRPDELGRYLKEQSVKRLLCDIGYQIYDAEEVLKQFTDRYGAYREGLGMFPHELGILLGYPVGDVKGYIEHQGKNFLAAGYWKVYEELSKAEAMFRSYDAARLWAAQAVAQGLGIRQLADRLTDTCLFTGEKV